MEIPTEEGTQASEKVSESSEILASFLILVEGYGAEGDEEEDRIK